MILVDTSVMIDYFKDTENLKTKLFQYVLDNDIHYGINKYIFTEVLQGSRTEIEFSLLHEYLEPLPVFGLSDGLESFRKAAMLNYKCRKKGITVRSTIDLIIAETAIENDLYILHNDGDFDNIASVIKELKIFNRKLL